MLPHSHEKALDKGTMVEVLRELDQKLEGIQRRIAVYCLGGTFMVLEGFRPTSKDMDFIVSHRDHLTLSGHTAEVEYKRGVRIDLFRDGFLVDYRYEDYARGAVQTNLVLPRMDVFYLEKPTFVLTKILAGRDRDYDDIAKVIPSPQDLPKETLVERFKNVVPASGKEAEMKTKFERFIASFYKTPAGEISA